MTRIVAGTAGGRSLVVPSRGTRPTADRVREALFSALESRMYLDGASVLDLYAGSGALGLEALSRGAEHVLLVENDARAAAVVARNIESVGLPGAQVRIAPVAAVVGGTPERRYDLVLADPPYSVSDGAVSSVLDRLVEGEWLAEDALVVVERSSRSPATVWPAGLVELKAKRYGEARIDMARFEVAQIEHPARGS
ncbi:16S rRNA (guanine(966)-N(2))-methyltransferase RsmD [Rhodococcus sp. SORGH_AS_0301]|uniref:16S rRNA (guanine(966)-N(2))-methyltransferase RsmD n=1 Tax=Rhodococcus sp. SORGH_AS_0301 TaxID=3041780 RepID=UPI0027842DAB|nr:16S rRNA (guanine(966)-N(2))-methyltransferase RsmD [Rhodococcus sp. SORGH_AS_0301]MDQ1179996.1 16S rRNA (guanine966-N2)-methyltransferase [Rhodococcus sp. SORGH_AS_0301]